VIARSIALLAFGVGLLAISLWVLAAVPRGSIPGGLADRYPGQILFLMVFLVGACFVWGIRGLVEEWRERRRGEELDEDLRMHRLGERPRPRGRPPWWPPRGPD
jgi:hypothetical protein